MKTGIQDSSQVVVYNNPNHLLGHMHMHIFRVGTPHSSIPLLITFRSCQGETRKHGSTCLLRIAISLQIMSTENFTPKGRIGENFCSVKLFWNPRNILIGLNYTKLQKSSIHYKHSFYNQLGMAKIFYSV